jgi:uncharacterized SAM-binding protein YcdF (DUF218 family)
VSDAYIATDAPIGDPTPVGGMSVVRPPRRWLCRVVLASVLLVVLAAGYYALTLYQVHRTGRTDEARPVDAIVVMGAAQYDGRPSAQLQARLDHVVTLWAQGLAPLVVVTGGKQPGDRFTEAEASTAYLVERGVPAEAIVAENTSRTSYDALVGAQSLLAERGATRVLIVSDPFHLLRSRLIAEEVGLTAYTSPTPATVITGGRAWRREFGEAAGVALGRIIGFDRLVALTG